MKTRIILGLGLVFAPMAWAQKASLVAAGNRDHGEVYEKIVIRRRMREMPDVTNVAGMTPQEMTQVAIPPPEPSSAEASEPRRLVQYFCNAWRDEDWKRLWWAMEPSYRKKVPFENFQKRFDEDAEGTGGLLKGIILDIRKNGKTELVQTELVFNFPRAKRRFVWAEVRRIPGGQYRIAESTIIPLDLDDL